MTMSRRELIWSGFITAGFGQLVAWLFLEEPTTAERWAVVITASIFASVVWACVSLLIKAERRG